MLVQILKLKRNIVLPAVMMFTTFAVASPCQAGPLWDWLFGRRRVAYAPVVAGGCNTCLSPVQRTTVNYVPQTVYRSRWARVPVTYYRPVASVDQCTGCPTNTTQACTTYQWQVQRVPSTVYRPVFAASSCCPTTASYAQTTYAAPAASSGCSSCSTGYASAATVQPTLGAQYLSAPAQTYAPGQTYVQPGQSSTGAMTVPAQPQPADLQPSLPAGGAQTQTSNYGAAGVDYGARTVVQQPTTSYQQQQPVGSGAIQQQNYQTQGSVLNPAQPNATTSYPPAPAQTRPSSPNTGTKGASFGSSTTFNRPTIRTQRPTAVFTPPPAANRTQPSAPQSGTLLAPIPSPEADSRNPSFSLDRVPQLLRPATGDKTAAKPVRQAAAYNTVAYPQRNVSPVQPVQHHDFQRQAPAATPAKKKYDHTGWKTAR